MMKWTLVMVLTLVCTPASAAKKHCKNHLNKLNTIKAQQRHGYSLSKGNSLAEREKKARKKWWDCETGKIKPKSKKYKLKKHQKPQVAKSSSKNSTLSVHSGKEKQATLTPFASERAVTFNSRFHGKQQQAWLNYYQPKVGCQRPESTQAFARCIEDKNKQQQAFEHTYNENKLTK